jgi:hypothetical protein
MLLFSSFQHQKKGCAVLQKVAGSGLFSFVVSTSSTALDGCLGVRRTDLLTFVMMVVKQKDRQGYTGNGDIA